MRPSRIVGDARKVRQRQFDCVQAGDQRDGVFDGVLTQ